MKISVITIISALLVCFSTSASNDWNKENRHSLSLIDEDKLYREVSFLADSICSGRATGTTGGTAAAFWISSRFDKCDLLPVELSFGQHFTTPTGACGHNIVGMIPGSYTQARDSYVIVGAHFDHLGVLDGKLYPGADANASGTVALTSIAEIFSSMKQLGKVYDSNIIFAAFDAKEMGMSGSENLWKLIEFNLLKDPISGQAITKDKILAMVNIDQLGSSLSPVHRDRKDYLIMLGTHSLPKEQRMNLEACNMLYGLNLDLCLSYYGSKTFTDVFYRLSDQKIFVENKIPSVFFTSGITMNTNKTKDNAENLDYKVLRKRIELIYYWIESIL